MVYFLVSLCGANGYTIALVTITIVVFFGCCSVFFQLCTALHLDGEEGTERMHASNMTAGSSKKAHKYNADVEGWRACRELFVKPPKKLRRGIRKLETACIIY